MNCLTCKYWVPWVPSPDKMTKGSCHRHSPTRLSEGRPGEWPVTMAMSGCGDYEKFVDRYIFCPTVKPPTQDPSQADTG